MSESIGVEDLDDLTLGAVFLATGGGGDPYLPLMIAKQALTQYGPVALVAPETMADESLVVPVGGVGAPTVSLELLPSISEAADALSAFEAHTGRSIDAVASFEVGGGNSLMPLVAAAAKGLPTIDGDGMGRAFPEAQMMSYAIAGVKPTPAVALDYAGNTAAFSTADTRTYEHHIRAFAAAAGGMITVAEHPMSGAQLKAAVIPHTLSFALSLGKTLRQHRGPAAQLMAPLSDCFSDSVYGECRLIFSGKVVQKSTRIVGGYDIGECRIEAFDQPERCLRIAIKNEYLLAMEGETVRASVPDLLVIVDVETGTPINGERLAFGQRVAVIAIGAPHFYRQPEALAVTAPRCFGLDVDYVPLELLD